MVRWVHKQGGQKDKIYFEKIINMAKILLVSSSFESVSLVTASEKNRTGVKIPANSHYPFGIAFLHSSLESKGHTVKSLFLNSYGYDDCFKIVTETVQSFKPDIV